MPRLGRPRYALRNRGLKYLPGVGRPAAEAKAKRNDPTNGTAACQRGEGRSPNPRLRRYAVPTSRQTIYRWTEITDAHEPPRFEFCIHRWAIHRSAIPNA